jgi:hypothetical protein
MGDGGGAEADAVSPRRRGDSLEIPDVTLRDVFAGLVVLGILASHARSNDPSQECDFGIMADGAYRLADALLKARGLLTP